MAENRDDIIEEVLDNSELARQLVPNKFKFTSQQGRIRRQKLIMSAKKLSIIKPIKDITLAQVCEEAGIPRASAYHFFPNIDAVFLALKFLNAIELIEAMEKVDINQFKHWQDYVTALMESIVDEVQADPSKAKLIYDTNTPDLEEERFGEQVNNKIVKLIYQHMADHYQMPKYNDIQVQLLVTFSIIDSIFTLSYRQHGQITSDYLQEAMTASLGYLHSYLPESLPLK
ncbi:TetR/AcrR family transcriptional regulator [Psychrobacter sp. I-STPA10]|uniref:TetR/AcrR family transcriptional regulator n=1 Tax=Psychrobacter sp. I-STPA10 TaxID=2585769 RepID=UPI001E38F02D|nr:TetR/AcrR family transcriptional regulator [Psychrobacter sp. I-STPA10]